MDKQINEISQAFFTSVVVFPRKKHAFNHFGQFTQVELVVKFVSLWGEILLVCCNFEVELDKHLNKLVS